MDLFNQNNEPFNILPKDGKALYFGSIFSLQENQILLKTLKEEIEWKTDIVTVFGKTHTMKRSSAWYGNKDLSYSYSGITRTSLPWSPTLLTIKEKIETLTKTSFNSCLLNYYPTGDEGMGWHADNEKELGQNPTIASISIGAERKFSFKHNTTKENASIILENGSLLLMKEETQHFWKHTLPKTKKITTPRINLTFRNII